VGGAATAWVESESGSLKFCHGWSSVGENTLFVRALQEAASIFYRHEGNDPAGARPDRGGRKPAGKARSCRNRCRVRGRFASGWRSAASVTPSWTRSKGAPRRPGFPLSWATRWWPSDALGAGVTSPRVGDRVGSPGSARPMAAASSVARGTRTSASPSRPRAGTSMAATPSRLIARLTSSTRSPRCSPTWRPHPSCAPAAVGYRSLRLTGLRDGEALGLTGFGASGHSGAQDGAPSLSQLARLRLCKKRRGARFRPRAGRRLGR